MSSHRIAVLPSTSAHRPRLNAAAPLGGGKDGDEFICAAFGGGKDGDEFIC